MVGCPLYIVRSSKQDAKTQYAILVPDINNLIDHAETIHLQGGSSQIYEQFRLRLSYANRIVGGAEEAAFRFLTDLKARQQIGTGLYGISDFVVIAMGKVAWDGNQMNRSCSYKVGTYYKEMDVYLAANSYDDLGGVREIPLKNGEVFMAPATPVPALVAANLAAGNHWCSGFAELVKEQKQFQIMKFKKEGFAAMKKSIRSEEDQAFIEVFHEAWFRTLGQIGERARREGLDYNRLVEVEQERVRNTILRMRSIHQLNTWFMRFCSASSLAPLNSLVEKGNIILRMFESPKNYERLQSLCLFALLSYESRNPSKKDNQPSDDKTNGNESSDNRSNA
jgi:CRISPR-associated protein Cas8a1/Csx13